MNPDTHLRGFRIGVMAKKTTSFEPVRPISFLLPALLALSFALFSTGCGLFDPPNGHKDDTTGTFVPPPLDSPQNTLINLKYAWMRKDSLKMKEIYDDEYQGTSEDKTDNTQVPIFYKGDEVDVVTKMGQRQEITNIYFDLKEPSTWIQYRDENDPQDWLGLQVLSFSIQVDDQTGTLLANSPSIFQFKFKPYEIAAGDTIWKIIRWKEVRTGI